MKVKTIILVAVVAAVSFVAGATTVLATKRADNAAATAQGPTISELLSLVNAERAKKGVAPLKEDLRLDASAQLKVNDEVVYGYFDHISPSNSPHAGKDSHDYIFGTGISCIDSSENLSEGSHGTPTAKQVVDGWIASPAHHAAMLKAGYTLTGFGINGNEIAEHFCQQ